MFDFSNLFVVFVAIAAFFGTDYPAALFFPGWSQKLITTPAETCSQEAPTITQTIISVLRQTATVTVVPPNNMIAIRTLPLIEPSFPDVLFTLLQPLRANISNTVFACLVGALLVIGVFGFIKCCPSPTAIDHGELHQFQTQESNKDVVVQEIRTAHTEAPEMLYHQYRVRALELDIALADRDQTIGVLQRKLEQSESDIVQAWYVNDDKISKYEQNVVQLQDANEGLDVRLDAAKEFVYGADERIEAAEKGARIVAEEASIKVKAIAKAADEKLDRARQSYKDAISAEKQRAETAIENVMAQQVKIDDMEKELKQLTARLNMTIEVPNSPISTPEPTKRAAAQLRLRLQAIPTSVVCDLPATPVKPSASAISVEAPSVPTPSVSAHKSMSKICCVSTHIVCAAEPEVVGEYLPSPELNAPSTPTKSSLIASTIATPLAVTTLVPTTPTPGTPGTPSSSRSIPRRKTRTPGPFKGLAPTGKYKKP